MFDPAGQGLFEPPDQPGPARMGGKGKRFAALSPTAALGPWLPLLVAQEC